MSSNVLSPQDGDVNGGTVAIKLILSASCLLSVTAGAYASHVLQTEPVVLNQETVVELGVVAALFFGAIGITVTAVRMWSSHERWKSRVDLVLFGGEDEVTGMEHSGIVHDIKCIRERVERDD